MYSLPTAFRALRANLVVVWSNSEEGASEGHDSHQPRRLRDRERERERKMPAVNMRCSTKTYARRKTYAHNSSEKRSMSYSNARNTHENKREYKRRAVAEASMAYAPHRGGGGGGGGNAATTTRRSLSAVRVNPAVAYGRQKMSVRAMGNPNTTVREFR